MTKSTIVAPEYLTITEEREFDWNDCPLTVEEKKALWSHYGNQYSPARTLTLRGRLEWRHDYKTIFRVLSKTKGLISSRFFRENMCEWVEVSWLIETIECRQGLVDHRSDTQQFIEEFIYLLRQEDDLHVFIESLVPVNQHDPAGNGSREGNYWSDYRK